MPLAEPLYANATFWTAMGIPVALLIGALGAWVTWRVAYARRRIHYWTPLSVRLLRAPDTLSSTLELRRNGALLTNPRVVEVALAVRGHHDIANDDFNNGDPLILDLGTNILDILDTDSENGAAPPITVDSTTLKIGPGLISRRQAITITVLTDGDKDPHLTCRNNLINIDPVNRDPTEATTKGRVWKGVLLNVGALAMAGIVSVVLGTPSDPAPSALQVVMLAGGLVAGTAIVVVAMTWGERPRR